MDNRLLGLEGYCPGCGHETLYRGFGGHIACDNDDCPRPDVARSLFADRHVIEHVVKVAKDRDGVKRWTMMHPLYERVDDVLHACPLAAALRDMQGLWPDQQPGLYLVGHDGVQWLLGAV